MSNIGKVGFFVAGLCLIAIAVPRLILNAWMPIFTWVPMAIGLVGIALSVFYDLKFYMSFFTMRTTKHGMNMGLLILLVIVGLVMVNFVVLRHDKKWDVTQEGLNSLSDQSVKILEKIKEPLMVKVFYRKGTQEIDGLKGRFAKLVEMYGDKNNNVKLEFIDIIKRPDQKEDFQLDKENLAAFVVYKGKKNKIDELTEEAMTKALIKVTREQNKVIYFTAGHGEKDINSQQQDVEGASDFKKELGDASYEVKDVKLFETGKVPDDAQVLIIAGPQKAFLDAELKALRDYVEKGGKLLIALDPGQQSNLNGFLNQIGVDYQNNYVLDQFGQIVGLGASVALGVT